MSLRALVCTDGSEHSRKTCLVAARLARPLKLQLTLSHSLDLRRLEYKMIPDFQVEMIRQGAKRAAEELLQKEAGLFAREGMGSDSRLLVGVPGPAICDFARRERMDLVILGRRGHGDLQDLLFGSVSSHVVHHSEVPVLVVQRDGPQRPADRSPVRVLVGVDGSTASERCLDFLASLVEAHDGLQVTLLTVVNPERPGLEHLPAEARYEALRSMHREAEGHLAPAADRLSKLGFEVATRVEEGTTGRTICRVYREDGFEILLVGRRGTGELEEVLFGSVCHFVLHHCPGHVLVVP
ncbi:MAG: universal stress protein [Deferrisomatales bacterium]|nr:universal stress protein [Deferrisomatales bacterium]